MNEEEHHREVYAHFGLAVYQAQVLESGLINALVVLDFMPSNISRSTSKTDWSNKFDAFFDSRAALTMGNLVQALRKVTDIPDELENHLQDALEKRRFLIHHYFREKILLFTTRDGRNEMIREFNSYVDTFINADRTLDAIVNPIVARYGLTTEKLDDFRKKMVEEYQSRAAIAGRE